MPRVSILLTCYNHLAYLPLAIQGVLDQTFDDYEILALDDGSTDGSREWLKQHEGGKMRCIFNEHNIGTYGTLNVGLREAKGEFVCILNDDDLWGPRKLEAQLEVFEKNPKVGIVHTGGWFIDDDGRRHPEAKPMGFAFPKTQTGDLLPMLMENNNMITSSVMVRKEAFDRCGEFDPSFYGCGDWHMWLRIAIFYHIGYADEPLTFYRVHGSNAAWNEKKMLDDTKRIREAILKMPGFGKRLKKDAWMRKAMAHNLACLGTQLLWDGDASGGRKAYRRSIKIMPFRFKTYARFAASFLPKRAFRALDRA